MSSSDAPNPALECSLKSASKDFVFIRLSSSVSPDHNTECHMSWIFTLLGSFTFFSTWDTLYSWPETDFSLAFLRMLVIYSHSPCLFIFLNEILLFWTPQVPVYCMIKYFSLLYLNHVLMPGSFHKIYPSVTGGIILFKLGILILIVTWSMGCLSSQQPR